MNESATWDELDEVSTQASTTDLVESTTSLQSFWVGCCGLAVFSLWIAKVSCYLTGEPLQQAFLLVFGMLNINRVGVWFFIQPIHVLTYLNVAPTIVVGATVAPLLWRGRISWRVLLSSCIVFVGLGIIMSSGIGLGWATTGTFAKLLPYGLALTACWIAFPCIYLLAPFNRTRWLRCATGGLLVLLMVCLVIIAMGRPPIAYFMLNWLSFCSAALVLSVIRRNWGGMFIVEADGNQLESEETSSGTLLEIMSIGGLLTAVVLPWTNSYIYDSPWLILLSASAGFTTMAAGLLIYERVLARKRSFPWLITILWFVTSLIGAFQATLRYLLWMRPGGGNQLETQIAITTIASLLATALAFTCIFLFAHWLRYWGWNLGKPSRG